MKTVLFFLVSMIGLFFSPLHSANIEDPTPPRTTKVCWVIFGSEVLCLTIEDTNLKVPAGNELKVNAEIASNGSYINLLFPSDVRNASFVVAENTSFNLCGAGTKTIKKGSRINLRNGVAKIPL